MSAQIQQAIINAHNAGDTAAAQRLADILNQQQAQAPQQSMSQRTSLPSSQAPHRQSEQQQVSDNPQQVNNVPVGERDNAFQYSIDQAQKMYGGFVENAGAMTGSEGLQKYGQEVQAQQDKDIKEGGYQSEYSTFEDSYEKGGVGAAFGWAAEGVAENAMSGGAALVGAAGTALAAYLGAPAWAILGIGGLSTLNNVALNTGENVLEQKEKLDGDFNPYVAQGTGILAGLLDSFGAGKAIPESKLASMTVEQVVEELFKQGKKSAAEKILKRVAAEGLTEAGQESLSMTSTAALGGDYTVDEVRTRLTDSFLLGSATSATVNTGIGTAKFGAKTIKGAVDLVSSNSPNINNETDSEAAASFAQQLAATAEAEGHDLQDLDKMSTKGARQAVDDVHVNYTEILKQKFLDLKERLGVTESDDLSSLMEKIQAKAAYRKGRNKTKSTVSKADFDAIEKLAGDTYEGQEVLSILRQLNQLTEVHNAGYQGGVSLITDQLSPVGSTVGYDRGATATEKLLRPIVSGQAAISSGGATLAAQGAAWATGRLIDKATGKRSKVARYISDNAGNQGIPAAQGPSLRMQRKAQLDAEAQAAEESRLRQEQYKEEERQANLRRVQQGAPPKQGSPEDIMRDATGLDRSGLAQVIRILKANPRTLPATTRAIESYETSVATGGRVDFDLYRDINALVDQYPQLQELMVRPRNAQAAAQGQAQQQLSQATENYNQGKQDNREFRQQLEDALDSDRATPPVQKAHLKSALSKLGLDLSADPVGMVDSILARAAELGVSQEAVDQYLTPYAERVRMQQEAKAARDAAQADADPVNDARVLPIPGTNSRLVDMATQGQAMFTGKQVDAKSFDMEQSGNLGAYIDLDTGENHTGKTFTSAAVTVDPQSGRPSMETSDTETSLPNYGNRAKDAGRVYHTNLVQNKSPQSLWSWTEKPDGVDHEAVVVTTQGKFDDTPETHVYALSYQSDAPVELFSKKFDPAKDRQADNPVLRPKTKGTAVLGNKVGSIFIKSSRKVHPVYDQVTIADNSSQVDPVNDSREPGFNLDLGDMGSNPMRVSPSYPQGVKSTLNPLEQNLQIGLDSVKNDPVVLKKIATKLRNYTPLAGDQQKDDNAFLEQAIESYKGNLLSLFDSVSPEYRDRAKLWYVGANKLAQEAADLYDLPLEAVSGVYASLSPQQDWYVNYDIGMRTIDIFKNHQDTPFGDTEYKAFTKWISAKHKSGKKKGKFERSKASRDAMKADAAEMLNKPFKELSTVQQGFYVRFWDEVNNAERGHRVVTPEGGFADWARVKNGDKTTKKWNSFGPIVKSLEILADPSRENIHVQLGEMHKVRSFYNNILDPLAAEGDVTIDTHAIAAALLRPLAGSHIEVKDNFGSAGASKNSGVFGSYGVFAEAYRRAANEAGVQPREMQSITWEAVRGLFPAAWKAQKKNHVSINSIWDDYNNGKISLDDARKTVYETAGNIRAAQWEDDRPNFEISSRERSQSDSGPVPVIRPPRGDGRRSGSNAPGRVSQSTQEVDPSSQAISPGTGILSNAVSEWFRSPTAKQTKAKLEEAKDLEKFIIGKEGTRFENGLSTFEDYEQLANLVDVSVEVVDKVSPKNPEVKGNFGGRLGGRAGEIRVQNTNSTFSERDFLGVLAHEVGHAFEASTLDRTWQPSFTAKEPNTAASQKQEGFYTRGNTLREKMYDVLWKARTNSEDGYADGLPSAKVSKLIKKEIDILQDGTLVSFGNAPELGSKPIRYTEEQYTQRILDDRYGPLDASTDTETRIARDLFALQNKDIISSHYKPYKRYIKGTAEFIVDPLHFYLMNPKQMKATMPNTFKFMKDVLNKSALPIELHSNPLMGVLAFLMAGAATKLLQGEEEEERPQGILTPEPALLSV